MRDLSFYNEITQNINRNQQQQNNAAQSRLAAMQPWINLSKTASKLAFDEAKKANERAEARGKIKILQLQQFTPEQYNELKINEEKFSNAHSKINAESVKLRKQGVSFNVIDEIRSMSPWEQVGAAKQYAKQAGENYSSWLSGEFSKNELSIDLTEYGGRKFKLNEIETASELKAALGSLRENYFIESGLNKLNPIIIDDNAWKNITTAESSLIKAQEKDDRIKRGIVDTENATFTFKNGGKYVDYLNALAATYDTKTGKENNYAQARKMAEDTLKALANNPKFSKEEFEDLVARIAEETAPHMGKKYKDFDEDWIESLYAMNDDAWIEILNREDQERDAVYNSYENDFEDIRAKSREEGWEITEQMKKDFNDEVVAATGRNAEFLKNVETKEDTNDDQARENLTELKRLRPGNALYESDLLPYSNKIYREYISQVKESEDLRDFNDDYTEKIDTYIDRMITQSRNLTWFNKGGDLEFEMKDIMEADIDSIKRDLLTQYTPAQAYEQIKDRIRAKINAESNDPESYLWQAKKAIETTFNKGTTREFRKDLARAMAPLASNPSLYNSLVVVDKEYLDAAEKYRDTAQEGDPIPEIYNMIAKEFPTFNGFDLMNGQLKAAGLKPVEKPKIEQDIDKAPDNLLRTLRCQPTQTGLARCYIEVQRLKGEDDNGYQMDWSNPEFLTPGLEMTDTFPLPAGEKLIK